MNCCDATKLFLNIFLPPSGFQTIFVRPLQDTALVITFILPDIGSLTVLAFEKDGVNPNSSVVGS